LIGAVPSQQVLVLRPLLFRVKLKSFLLKLLLGKALLGVLFFHLEPSLILDYVENLEQLLQFDDLRAILFHHIDFADFISQRLKVLHFILLGEEPRTKSNNCKGHYAHGHLRPLIIITHLLSETNQIYLTD